MDGDDLGLTRTAVSDAASRGAGIFLKLLRYSHVIPDVEVVGCGATSTFVRTKLRNG